MWADNGEADQNTVATKCRCCVYTDGNYTSRRNRFYSSFSAAAQIFVMLFKNFWHFNFPRRYWKKGINTAGLKYTLRSLNAVKCLNKHSEVHTQCNRSLSGESRPALGPLQGSCCGQANCRNADWYPKGSGLRISLSASLFFFFFFSSTQNSPGPWNGVKTTGLS